MNAGKFILTKCCTKPLMCMFSVVKFDQCYTEHLMFRYFCGLSTTPKQQMTLIVEFFNTCFTKNKAAARDGKHAVTFVECQEIAKRVLAANKVDER